MANAVGYQNKIHGHKDKTLLKAWPSWIRPDITVMRPHQHASPTHGSNNRHQGGQGCCLGHYDCNHGNYGWTILPSEVMKCPGIRQVVSKIWEHYNLHNIITSMQSPRLQDWYFLRDPASQGTAQLGKYSKPGPGGCDST